MSIFNSLPNEITLKIICLVHSHSLKIGRTLFNVIKFTLEPKAFGQIRLISCRLNELACSILFSRLKFQDFGGKLQHYKDIASDIELGATNVFKYTIELEIRMECPEETDGIWLKFLDGVIPTMENLRSIS